MRLQQYYTVSNAALSTSAMYSKVLFHSAHRYPNPQHVQPSDLSSTVGLYVETSDAGRQFAVTSAHHSCLGTACHLSESQPGLVGTHLGFCTHHFLGDGLDVALVEMRDDIPKQRLVNILEVPYLGQIRKYMPEIWTCNLMSLTRAGTSALKHGPRGLVPGRLVAARSS